MKKSKLIILQLFIAAVLISTSVYAAVSTTIGVSVPNASVKRGNKVTVTLSLKDVDSSKKVTSVEGYVNYNTNIFETITVDSIQKNSDNTVDIGNEKLKVEDLTNADLGSLPNSSAYVAFNGSPRVEGNEKLKVEDLTNADLGSLPNSSAYVAFNGSPRGEENNTKIVIDFNNGITSNTDLLKIDFKVKSDATLGEVKDAISYSNFRITAGSETVEVTEKINLNIEAAGNPTNPDDNKDDDKNEKPNEKPSDKNENKNNSNDDKNQNKNNSKNENKNVNTNKNTNNTNKNVNTNKNTNNANKSSNISGNKASNVNRNEGTASGVLPATGAKIVIIPAIVLAVLAYVSYKKYVNYKDI